MEFSLFYFVFILSTLLFTVVSTEFGQTCPTSRRLLLFNGFPFSFGEKKSLDTSPSSPPKYARTGGDSHVPVVYIQPQTSNELGHKVRSYAYLLTSKLYTSEERASLKQRAQEKKKQALDSRASKRNNTIADGSSSVPATKELVALNDDEIGRCRELLHIDPQPGKKHEKKSTKGKGEKKSKKDKASPTVKTIKKKTSSTPPPPAPAVNEKQTAKKVKVTSSQSSTVADEKKPTKTTSARNQPGVAQPSSASSTREIPIQSPPSPPPSSKASSKSKRDRPYQPPVVDEADDEPSDDSVVDRAFHFVRNMFQLSDDLRDTNHTDDDDAVIDIAQEQQQQQHHHHHARKLLSVSDVDVDDKLSLETSPDLLMISASIAKRQLLSVKANKHSSTSKEKKSKSTKASAANADAHKPKVGWAYRYRISRYLTAQKMKRTGSKSKVSPAARTKRQPAQPVNGKLKSRKLTLSTRAKVSKRKLLEYHPADASSWHGHAISNEDIVDSVSITQEFIPRRQLLASKTKAKQRDEDDDDDVKSGESTDDDDDDNEKSSERRRLKSLDELTDPVAIVRSYDRGLFKPRVGWQFRYRVSRYVDLLRENIREDQQRLKQGLQAIKRKTPQELSGRRKRVLDKPFAASQDESKKTDEQANDENKPNVGWRYRYRISKMQDAKDRGEYVDDEEERRKTKAEQKLKQHGVPVVHDEDWGKDLDPELRQVSEEGKHVGWAYRYRIRRKIDDLKRLQSETGVPFDLETLGGGKREKSKSDAAIKAAEKAASELQAEQAEKEKKTVGWEYRYRVSKMREAQKHEKPKSKKQEKIVIDASLDPILARLKPEERIVGWAYRYRIRRKLDTLKGRGDDAEGGKRSKKTVKGKSKEKVIKQVEESIEKILNIDDIDETPFMEYVRRGSSYVLLGLIPTAKRSICLLPLPTTFSFCNDEFIDQATQGEKAKAVAAKKLRTKKEQRAKQFIRSHATKLGAEDKVTERRVDETMKDLYKSPSMPPPQTPVSSANTETATKKPRVRSTRRRSPEEQTKHVDEEEHPLKKVIGVETKKKKNKKQYQLIGKEVKPKVKSTISSTPASIESLSTPSSEAGQDAAPRLRSIAEVIQAEAATILSAKRSSSSRTPEELQEEINETNEMGRERASGDKHDHESLTSTHNKHQHHHHHQRQSKESALDLENTQDSS